MWLKFKIPIETEVKPIKFELWLPIENANESDIGTPESGDQDSSDLNAKVLLQRSISGKRAHSVINCNYLIPLTLNVVLPDAYPSEVKPHYIISSIWLNEQQLYSLSLKLDEIWNENFNMPVLYTWCEWLQYNLINHLDLLQTLMTKNDHPIYIRYYQASNGLSNVPFHARKQFYKAHQHSLLH